jgi:hypothetical protein
MGDDDIVVGNNAPIRKPSKTIARRRSRLSACGEMAQQHGHSNAQSTPQKLLQLVGFRDPNAGTSVKR